MSASQNPNPTDQPKAKSTIDSYSTNIYAILNSRFAQIYISHVQFYKSNNKRAKMSDIINKKPKTKNWMAIFKNLLLKTSESDDVPKLVSNYLELRAKTELKYLKEKTKKTAIDYSHYVDVYLSKLVKQIKKNEERLAIENVNQMVQYGFLGIRRIKVSQSIRIVNEDNSEDDELKKSKKKEINDQINKIKNDSKLELDEIVKYGNNKSKIKYTHVKSKYLVTSASSNYGRNILMTVRENEKTSIGANTVVNTQSSINENEYNYCMTEPKNTKKAISFLKKRNDINMPINYKITPTPILPKISEGYNINDSHRSNKRNYKKKVRDKVKDMSVPFFRSQDFYY